LDSSDKQIIDICCDSWHLLVLTNSGEVYAWHYNEDGKIGTKEVVLMNINQYH
jgi:alpha-tubulin suppressor-like RCC1 family protein